MKREIADADSSKDEQQDFGDKTKAMRELLDYHVLNRNCSGSFLTQLNEGVDCHVYQTHERAIPTKRVQIIDGVQVEFNRTEYKGEKDVGFEVEHREGSGNKRKIPGTASVRFHADASGKVSFTMKIEEDESTLSPVVRRKFDKIRRECETACQHMTILNQQWESIETRPITQQVAALMQKKND